MDTCYTGGAEIWISAAVLVRLHSILHTCVAPTATEHCEGFWTRNGESCCNHLLAESCCSLLLAELRNWSYLHLDPTAALFRPAVILALGS